MAIVFVAYATQSRYVFIRAVMQLALGGSVFRWAKFCAAVAALGVVACGSARADLFDFSYTVFGGINASGTLTATLQSGSTYLITAISGTRNGQPILTLFAPGGYDGNDNLLYFPAGGPEGNAYLDTTGFSYTTADGNFNPWACGIASCAEDPPEYDEEHGTPNPTGSTIITSFSMTQESAPIPGAGALSYLLVLLGGLVRWRKTFVARARVLALRMRQWPFALLRRSSTAPSAL